MNQTNTTYRYRTGVIDETAHTLTLQQFNISQINVQFLLLLTLFMKLNVMYMNWDFGNCHSENVCKKVIF